MKTYEKPRLFALSLSGNDRLCGSCANGFTLWNNTDIAAFLMNQFGFGDVGDGIGRDDFEGVFGQEDQCSLRQIESYCKFTNADNGAQLVAWS